MSYDNSALSQLANYFGISNDYWNWAGQHVFVPQDSIIEILKALGVDASTPELAKLAHQKLIEKQWVRMLPSCLVAEQGKGIHLNVHVRAGDSVKVHIELEDGNTRPAWQIDNYEPDRVINGQPRGQATFWLGDDLPIGYHKIIAESSSVEKESSLIVTPNKINMPIQTANRRVWGYATQLYSIRSKKSWLIGDLVDLENLMIWSGASQGADYMLINPLCAAAPVPPLEPSPYLPVSRRYLNPIYLRPEEIWEFHQLPAAKRKSILNIRKILVRELKNQDTIDRDAIWKAKISALRIIYQQKLKPIRQISFDSFCAREGSHLQDFTTWNALSFYFKGEHWQKWPKAYQNPNSDEVNQFIKEHADQIKFSKWLQWQLELQYSRAQCSAKNAGMKIGVMGDLPVGVSQFSADSWIMQDIYASEVSVGAPPDEFNPAGQNWAQPPWRPDKLAQLGYKPFIDIVRAALRNSGGVRIDHIMGLFRLWWIPKGKSAAEGAYVKYDHHAMVGILALEAYRANSLIVGEDLGTVEPDTRKYLNERGILGTSVLWFSKDDNQQPLKPNSWRSNCMASVTTHDLATTLSYLSGNHLKTLTEITADKHHLDQLEKTISTNIKQWVAQLINLGYLTREEHEPIEVMLAFYRYLADTPAKVLNVTLTDAVGDKRDQNYPGTINEYPNWRIPLADANGKILFVEDLLTEELPTRIVDAIT